MSSINKSGKRFTPKIKQRTRRVAGLMTPQSSQSVPLTQVSQASVESAAAPSPPVSQNVVTPNMQDTVQKEEDAVSQATPLTQDDKAHEPVEKENNSDEFKEVTQTHATPNKDELPTISFTESNNKREDDKVESAAKVKDTNSVKPPERKASVTGSGHMFTQPTTVVHRTRLNSLSIPTPLSTAHPTSRRGSVASNSNSRRGSIILPSANPIVPGGLGSRRGSVVNTLGPITPGSRRGSVNLIRPGLGPIVGSAGGDRSRRGSVTNNGEEKPIPIPILKTNKKRRTSVNYGPKKRKDVSVGGISIGGSLAIKKSDFSSLDTLRSGANKENRNTFLQRGENDAGQLKDAAMGEGQESTKDAEANEEKKAKEPPKKRKLEFTEFELESKQKWILNRKTNKYELVDVDPTLKDQVKEEEFEFEHEVESLSELGQMRRAHNARLGDSLKFNAKKIKLEDLCKPFLPVGELSKQYDRAMEAEMKLAEARNKRREIREKARLLRMSEQDVMKLSENGENIKTELSEKERLEKVKELMEKDRSEESRKIVVPLLQVQGNKVTYSHESTVVDRHEETNTEMEKVEENPFENIITSNSYSKRKTTLRWTPQEVAELLKAISLWGTDFGLIAKLFPHRTRKQVKAKFLLEEKLHPHLIEFALLRKLPVDIREYSGKTGIEFKTLDEYNRQIEQLKQKHEEELKAMAQAREQAYAEDREAQQNLHGNGSQGVPTRRSRKAVIAEFRKNEEVVGTIESSGN